MVALRESQGYSTFGSNKTTYEVDTLYTQPIAKGNIPDCNNCWRSGQLTLDSLKSMIVDHKVTRVIRMNGNGQDSGGVPIEQERRLCEMFNVEFYYLNAHKGYIEYKGYDTSNREAFKLLSQGNVIIHCLHGFDRTGSVLAYYLGKKGYTQEQIISYNGWRDYLRQKGLEYNKYFEAVYNAKDK